MCPLFSPHHSCLGLTAFSPTEGSNAYLHLQHLGQSYGLHFPLIRRAELSIEGPEASGKEAKLGFEPEAAHQHMMSHMTSYIRPWTTESKICRLETSTWLSMCQAHRQKDVNATS